MLTAAVNVIPLQVYNFILCNYASTPDTASNVLSNSTVNNMSLYCILTTMLSCNLRSIVTVSLGFFFLCFLFVCTEMNKKKIIKN